MIELAAFITTMSFFAWRSHRRDRQGIWRQAEARKDIHAVARDQFLCHALGDVRRRTGRILEHKLDLPAAENLPVLLQVGLHATENLPAVVGEGAGELGNDADPDGFRGASRTSAESTGERQAVTLRIPGILCFISFAPSLQRK